MIYSGLNFQITTLEDINTVPEKSFAIQTDSACYRNSIADITFYDSTNFVLEIQPGSEKLFPVLFIEKTREYQSEERVTLLKHLRPGEELPLKAFHYDWIIGIILISAFLFSLIRTSKSSLLPGVTRFFLFRGINDPSSRDISGIYHWQSTILNFISFLVISLFSFYIASYNNLISNNINGFIFWAISLGIIVSAVTLRHIICIITGSISGEKEVFMEYLSTIYQFYRFSALFLFVIIVLMSYTKLTPDKWSILSGIFVLGIMYFFRVLRLIIIFLARNISIFYLILYLCALEILPVLISVKYFSGLV